MASSSTSTSFSTRFTPAAGWSAWLHLLLLSVLSTALLVSDDFIQQLFIDTNHAELEAHYLLVLFLFSIGLWLLGKSWLVTGILGLLAVMQIIQLSHVSYFGEPLHASDIANMIQDFPDVEQAGLNSFMDHWHVLLSVLLPYGLLMFLHRRLPQRLTLPSSWWGLILVLAILAAKPYRATYRNMDAFMSGPTRSGLHNSLNAFSYYAVRLWFQEPVSLQAAHVRPYQIEPIGSDAKHVWLVVADSLRTDRLGVYGYGRDTTPNLSRLHADGQLIARRGIASGVTTAVSLPNMLNIIREPSQQHWLREQPHNLYRMAKANGYQTLWLSSQESKLLSHIGSRHIDLSITREDYPLRFLRRHDHAVADLLKEQPLADKTFAVFNLRTAHIPYEMNYLQHDEPVALWPVDPALSREEKMGNAYDNSLRYLDDVLADLIEAFNKLEGEKYLLITADHGQLLGENGRWGHNDLQPEVIEVPMMILAGNQDPNALAAIQARQWLSHFDMGVWAAERLGYRVINPNAHPHEHFNHGNRLLGDKHIQRITVSDKGLTFHPPELLSRWIKMASAMH